MNLNTLEHGTDVGPNTPITLTLESPRGRVTEIIIVREPAPVSLIEARTAGVLSLVPDDFDDDLANATWEDAEWR